MQCLGVPPNGSGLPMAIHPFAQVVGMTMIGPQLILMLDPTPTLECHTYGFLGFLPNNEPMPKDARLIQSGLTYELHGAVTPGRLIFRPIIGIDNSRRSG